MQNRIHRNGIGCDRRAEICPVGPLVGMLPRAHADVGPTGYDPSVEAYVRVVFHAMM